MPEAFRKLQGQMLRRPGGDREMVDILSLVLHLLHRLVDGKPTDQRDITPPSALSLSKEPEANVARYDGLRQARNEGGTRHAS